MKKNNLIVGNYSCANRGDLAILRGLLNILSYDKTELKIISNDVENAIHFLGKDYIIKDESSFFRKQSRIERYLFRILILSGLFGFLNKLIRIKKYNNVYFVGGSYLIDAYGFGKFDLLGYLLLNSKNVILVGHSVGPFDSYVIRTISKNLFKKCSYLGIRDTESLSYVKNKLGLSTNVELIPDTAFYSIKDKGSFKIKDDDKNLTICITVRELSPFDKILNISQTEYNKIFLDLIEFLLSKGVKVVVASMCTPLNGYHKDDRQTAKDIFKTIKSDKFVIIEKELSDLQLMELFKECDVLIGTRLHSCILAMTAGTPAIAIYYEHKSKGIYKKLELNRFSLRIQDLKNHEFIYETILLTLNREFIIDLEKKIIKERKKLLQLEL